MKNGSKRTISRLLAFVMLVSCMFTNIITASADSAELLDTSDVASGSAVATYSFDATTLTVGADKDPLTQAEVDPYFTVVGEITKRNSSDGTSVASVELAKNDGGQFSFTTTAESSALSFDFSSTGGTNTSAYAVLDSTGGIVKEGEVTGSANGRTTITVNDLAPDTYTITSPDKGYNRGGRIYTITVVEGGSLEEPAVPEDPTEGTTEAGTEVTTSAPSGETGTPEAGMTYSADFATLTVGDKLNGWSTADGIINVVSPADQAYVHDASHGAALFNGDQINVAVAGNATISLALCQYGNGTEFTVTDANGKVIDTVAGKATADGEAVTVNYMGDATVLTITLAATGEAYLHSVTAANAAAPVGEAKNFEIWLDDMAVDGVVATKAYTGDVVLTTGETVSLGDSILELQGQGEEQYTTSYGAAVGVIRDGKTVNGYKAGQRNATANDINPIPSQGDGCAIVFTPAATGMLNTYFVSTSFLRVWDFDTATGTRYGYTDSEVAAESYGVKVEAGHTYVLSTTGKTNNMAYCGFEYVVDEPATIGVSFNNINANESSIPNLEVYLTDATLGGEPAATVKSDTASVDLANGHTYILSTNDGGVKATVAGSDRFTVTGDAIVIDLEDIPDVTLTGEITGAAEGVTGLTFTNMVNGTVYTATITDNIYSVSLKPGDYDTAVETTNGAFTQDRVSVAAGEENVNEVYVEIVDPSKPATYSPADLFKLEHSAGVGARANDITAKPGDTITVPVDGAAVVTVTSYYQAAFTVNGSEVFGSNSNSTSVYDSFTVNTAEGDTSVVITFTDSYNGTAIGTSYLTSISVVPVVDFKSEINVPGDYDTLTDAVAAIKGMTRPEGEEGRVTINMTADIEEQVVFDAPYVTLNGNGHTLSWYYGVGTFYYSIDSSTGLYSETLYRDKYSSAEADGNLWGGVAIIRGDNFIAKDTTFLNTYNYYVTEKEASDVEHSIASMPERVLGADVTVYASKERSNAFYIDADNIEAYNCNILSSQDTLGRNGSANNNYHAYFKDCVIGGNTDYICGEFTATFDNCELQWKTFANDDSNNSKVGFITAPKTSPYIFRNCTVTTSGAEGEGAVSGLYGRTWGANSQAYFINTETNGYITESGWGEMNAGDGATSIFYEYNNTSNGEPFVTNGEFSKSLVWGDVNGDGGVDVIDVSLALDYTLQPESVKTFNTIIADVSEDGSVNSEDVALILQKVLDSSFTLPIEDTLGVPPEDSSEETSEEATEATTGEASEDPSEEATEATTAAEITTEAATEATTEAPSETGSGSVAGMPMVSAPADSGNMQIPFGETLKGSEVTVKTVLNFDVAAKAGALLTVSYDNNGTTSDSKAKLRMDTSGNIAIDSARDIALGTLAAGVDNTIEFIINTNDGTFKVAVNGGTPVESDLYVDARFANGIAGVKVSQGNGTDAQRTTTVNEVSWTGNENASSVPEETTEAATEATTEAATEATTEGGGTEPAGDVTVYVVGDSTACHYGEESDPYYWYKRVGFGDKLQDYFNDNVTVVNLALSGRSSKSFATGINENGIVDAEAAANYAQLKNDIKAGDYLIIAWGHNDEKTDQYRYTDPNGDMYTEGSFKNSLYENYIKVAQDAGATPILCTPIIRANASGTLGDNDLHKPAAGDYGQCIRDLAAELNITLIDNLASTKALFETIGAGTAPTETAEPTGYLALHAAVQDLSADTTHLNAYGASMVAYMIARDIKASDNSLATYVADGITEPVFSQDECYNTNWEPFNEAIYVPSSIWKVSEPWAGSVFGASVGSFTEDNHPNHDIIGQGENSVQLIARNNKGKIATDQDGLVMYFQEIGADQDFTFTATAHINSYDASNNQSGFGLMLRDNMFSDYEYKTQANYFAVGNTAQNSGKNKVSVFRRLTEAPKGDRKNLEQTVSTTLTTAETKELFPEGTEVELKISRTNGIVTVQYGNEPEYTFNDTLTDLTKVNAEKDYVGVFVSRAADVTFSNLNLVLNNAAAE